jgi:hypothetical protein
VKGKGKGMDRGGTMSLYQPSVERLGAWVEGVEEVGWMVGLSRIPVLFLPPIPRWIAKGLGS